MLMVSKVALQCMVPCRLNSIALVCFLGNVKAWLYMTLVPKLLQANCLSKCQKI